MKTFRLTCRVTVSAYTEVLAASIEEAKKIAAVRDVQIGGNGTYPDESWIVDDADGAPDGIEADE